MTDTRHPPFPMSSESSRETGRILTLALVAGLMVANNYYNQALLVNIAHTFGVRESSAGWLSVLTQLGYATGLCFLSPLGDRIDRRKLLMGTAAVAGLMMLALAAAPALPILLVVGFFGGFACVTPSLSVAHAASLVPHERRGRAVGTVMSGLLTGILLARAFAGLVGEHYGWRCAFAGGAVLSAVAVLALATLPKSPVPETRHAYLALLKSLPAIFRREPALRRHAALGGLAFFGFGAFWTTLGFRLASLPEHYDGRMVGIFGVVAAAGVLAAGFAGKLTDIHGSRKVSMASLALCVASFALIGVSGNSMIVLGVGVFLMDAGVQATHVTNYSRALSLSEHERGRFNSLYMVTYFLSAAAGSAIGNYAWQHSGWTGVCTIAGAVAALGLRLATKPLPAPSGN